MVACGSWGKGSQWWDVNGGEKKANVGCVWKKRKVAMECACGERTAMEEIWLIDNDSERKAMRVSMVAERKAMVWCG